MRVTAKLCWLLVFGAGCAVASAESGRDLKQILGERLLVMPDVAAYKWLNDLPVEDADREAQVLAATVEQASRSGVDRAWARQVVRAQIDAAKRIQSRWFAKWNSDGGPARAPELVTEIRPRISELTAELIAHLVRLDARSVSAEEIAALREVPAALRDDRAAWMTAVSPWLGVKQ